MSEDSKICRKCGQSRPPASFYVRPIIKDGLSSYCIDCTREDNATRYQERAPVGRHKRCWTGHERLITEFVLNYLASHPCVDCGETDIVVLTFDHLPEHTKVASISQMSRTSCPGARTPTYDGCHCLPLVEQEIAKCDVVCANDHARRTSRRSNWLRTRFLTPQGD